MKKRIYYICIIIILIVQIAIVAYDVCSGLYYASNDDSTMSAILGGRYVSPSEYSVFLNIVLGYFLKTLYALYNKISWLTIIYLTVYILGLLLLDLVVLKLKNRSICGKVFALVAVTVSFIIMFSYFTFTEVAYWAYIAAFVSWIALEEKVVEEHCIMVCRVISIFLLIMGVLIRRDVFLCVVFIYTPLAVYQLIKKKNQSLLKFLLLNIILFFLAIGIDKVSLYSNDIQHDFSEWTNARHQVVDYTPIPYDASSFDTIGVSKSDYDALYGTFFYNYNSISTSKLEEINKQNTFTNRYNLDIVSIIESMCGKLLNIKYFHTFYYIFYVLIVLICFINGKKIATLAFSLLPVFLEICFFVIQRPIYRVVMPPYILAALMMVLLTEFGNNSKKEIVTSIVSIGLLLGCIYQRYNNYLLYSEEDYISSRRQVVDYMYSNNDKLFIAADAYVFQCEVAVPAIENYGIVSGNLMGNWEIYSKPYYDLCESMGIDNPNDLLYESIVSDKVLFITSQGSTCFEQHPYILGLAQEYYGQNIHFEVVDEIVETETEKWIVYKAVAE